MDVRVLMKEGTEEMRYVCSLSALALSTFIISVVFAIIPLCNHLLMLAFALAVSGLAMGVIDTISNLQLVKIYQKDSTVFLQALKYKIQAHPEQPPAQPPPAHPEQPPEQPPAHPPLQPSQPPALPPESVLSVSAPLPSAAPPVMVPALSQTPFIPTQSGPPSMNFVVPPPPLPCLLFLLSHPNPLVIFACLPLLLFVMFSWILSVCQSVLSRV
nr:uncharacterized protein LOC129431057 [Misgurnus anguillicaudatus]